MNIRLSNMVLGKSGRIIQVDSQEMEQALLSMGVVSGDFISLSDKAPLGDPIAIAVNGTKISIRKKDAASIWIQPQEEPPASL
ncbi:MAG: ferrous iron transport protein A [Bacteroidetes bacterium]|nr:MAG: ferrous iron transport protein A [Bacteroidota bacterium]